jgi:hypothetical protein
VGKTICERTSLLPRSCVVSSHLAAVGVSLTCESPATGKGSLRHLSLRWVIPTSLALIAIGTWWTATRASWALDDDTLGQALYCLGFVLLLLRFYPSFQWLQRRPFLDKLITVINSRAIAVSGGTAPCSSRLRTKDCVVPIDGARQSLPGRAEVEADGTIRLFGILIGSRPHPGANWMGSAHHATSHDREPGDARHWVSRGAAPSAADPRPVHGRCCCSRPARSPSPPGDHDSEVPSVEGGNLFVPMRAAMATTETPVSPGPSRRAPARGQLESLVGACIGVGACFLPILAGRHHGEGRPGSAVAVRGALHRYCVGQAMERTLDRSAPIWLLAAASVSTMARRNNPPCSLISREVSVAR